MTHALDIDVDLEFDLEVDTAECALDTVFAFDKRTTTVDGFLVVPDCKISAARVNGYLGAEIPGAAQLGLQPDKVYELYRDAAELEAAAPTYERIPLLMQHTAVTATDPQKFLTVGTVSNIRFRHPFLIGDLTVWSQEGIDAIESGKLKALSCGYRYICDLSPGQNAEGLRYDGVMRKLIANHLALVEAGRAGPDILVADSLPTFLRSQT